MTALHVKNINPQLHREFKAACIRKGKDMKTCTEQALKLWIKHNKR